jgi:hypothetical protein
VPFIINENIALVDIYKPQKIRLVTMIAMHEVMKNSLHHGPMKYHLGAVNALNQVCSTLTVKVFQAGKEAVTNPLSQYHLGAGYALNWCEAAHYIIRRESASG